MSLVCRVINKSIAFALFAVLVVSMGCPAAFADSIASYALTLGSPDYPASMSPLYGRVDLLLVGNSIQVTVTGTNGWAFFGFGTPMFGFNVMGDKGGLSIMHTNNFAVTLNPYTQPLDGFGTFDANLFDGSDTTHPSFSFVVSRTAGFSDVNQIYAANANGTHFAAHVSLVSSKNSANGYVADSVPEPSSLLTLGCALLSLGLYCRFGRA